MNIPVDPLMRTARPDEGIFIRTRLLKVSSHVYGAHDYLPSLSLRAPAPQAPKAPVVESIRGQYAKICKLGLGAIAQIAKAASASENVHAAWR